MKRRTVFPIAGIALLLGSLVLPFGVQSCSVTRNGDGSWTAQIAPELAITAQGLEDALRQLNELLEACTTGGLEHDCSPQDIAAIRGCIQDVIAAKRDYGQRVPPKSPTPPQRQPPAPQPG